MALTPKELELTHDEMMYATELERKIDKFLLEHYIGEKIIVKLSMIEAAGTPIRVVHEAVRRYQVKEGWKYVRNDCYVQIEFMP